MAGKIKIVEMVGKLKKVAKFAGKKFKMDKNDEKNPNIWPEIFNLKLE